MEKMSDSKQKVNHDLHVLISDVILPLNHIRIWYSYRLEFTIVKFYAGR